MNLEQEVVTRIIWGQKNLNTMRVRPSDLADPMWSQALAACISLSARGVSLDPMTVGNEVKGYLTDIVKAQAPADSNFTYWEDQLIKQIESRRLGDVLLLMDELVNGGKPATEVRAEIEEALSRSVVQYEYNSIQTVFDLACECGKRLEERSKAGGKLPGISTGFAKLDELTGGFQPGTYYIGARPSQGKTALMLTMMSAAVKNGKGVGLISIESSGYELVNRLISADSAVDASRIKTGSVTPSDIGRIGDSVTRMKTWNGHIYFNTKADIATVEAVARRMVRDMGVDLIFVDYLQRINAKGGAKWEQVAAASRGITDIAKGMQIPVICLAQTGRIADNEPPSIGHFQHSSAIEQDADIAMVITNDVDEIGDEDSKLNVLKNRDGSVGFVRIYFDRAHVRFTEKANDN